MTSGNTGAAARWLCCLAAASIRAAPALAAEPPREPMLMIDSGGHTALVRSLVFTKDGGRIVSAADDKTIRVWDWRSGKTERQIFVPAAEGEFGKVYALALSPDEKRLAVASEARPYCINDDCIVIRLYDFASGRVERVFRDPGRDIVLALDFSPDGTRLLSGGQGGAAIVWDVSGFEPPRWFKGHDDDIYAARFTPDGKRVVTCSDDMTVKVWDAATGEVERTFEMGKGTDLRLALSARGDRIAAGASTGAIRVWDVASGQVIRDIGPMSNVLGALAFDATGEFLIAGTVTRSNVDEAPTVWRVVDGHRVRGYQGQLGETVNVASLSPDGSLVATGGMNGAIHVWDWRTGQGRKVLAGVGRQVWAVDLTADGGELSWGVSSEGDSGASRGPVSMKMTLPHKSWFWNASLGAPGGRWSSQPRGLPQKASTGDKPGLSLRTESGGEFNWEHILKIFDGGTELARIQRTAQNGFRHTAYGFAPDGGSVVSGGDNGQLYRYALNGSQIATYDGHLRTVWSVAGSNDGLLASGGEDQTVRLWNLETGAAVATLFHGTDGSWVMWTPQGYFTGSADAARRFGWLVNDGFERAPRYLRAGDFEGLHRPDVVEASILARRPLDTNADGAELLADRIGRKAGK